MSKKELTESKLRKLVRDEIQNVVSEMKSKPMAHQVPATITSDRMGNIIVEFEYNGKEYDRYLQRSQEIETLKNDSEANEEGISDMEEAVDEAMSGWTVDILLHDERARMWARASEEGF